MADHPNPPPPPPPPPHPGHHGHHGHHGHFPPPPPPPPFSHPMPWQDAHPFDAGYGVDHTFTGPDFNHQGFGGLFGPHSPWDFWSGRRGGGGHRRGGRHGGEHGQSGPWGRRGGSCRSRRCRRGQQDDEDEVQRSGDDETMRDVAAGVAAADISEKRAADPEKHDTPGTMAERDGDEHEQHPDPPEEVPFMGWGAHRGRGRHGRHGGPWHAHHHQRHHHHAGPSPPPPPPPPYGGFDFRAMMQHAANNPMFHQVRSYVDQVVSQARRGPGNNTSREGFTADADHVFSPPVDLFDHEQAWTVHVALPGAKKEDIGVSWLDDKSELLVSGVVSRPGDEDFLAGLVNGERRIGLFERKIKLPPPTQSADRETEEVDSDGITAKMVDGILVIVVPKAEKDWTEVKKIDVE